MDPKQAKFIRDWYAAWQQHLREVAELKERVASLEHEITSLRTALAAAAPPAPGGATQTKLW